MSDVDRFVRFCESEFGSAIMDREAAYVNRHVDPRDRILDVGCGIGSLEERFSSREIVGVDRSSAMVRAARDRTSARVLRGDARALPIGTDTIDAVVFVATLAFVPDIDAALSEAIRVLESEGTVVALLLNTRSEYVQEHRQREGSYFQRMVHRDTEAVVETVFEYVDGRREYVIGIRDGRLVDSSDPNTAAITAVVGSPVS